MFYPYQQEIPYQDPLRIFQCFAFESGSLFLDSSRLMPHCGRYSYIAADPFFILNVSQDSLDPFQALTEQLNKFPLLSHQDMPPFQGGVAGFLSYDVARYLEKLPVVADDMQFPDAVLGFYDVVIAFDHEMKRAWIFSSGYPLTETVAREKYAQERCHIFLEKIEKSVDWVTPNTKVCREEEIQSNFSQDEYEAAVKQAIDYILAGDIFEVNISQRFKVKLPDDFSTFELYRRLRLINAAPFSAYLNFDDTVIASASPERFLKVSAKYVETRPIKGTRRRSSQADEDVQLANELVASEKDRAENVMIVDLLRNDLSRVCEDHTVLVPQLCALESYATVHHLVSVVTGKLKEECSIVDLLRATFPGGSITGAPKVRAMEIIAEIEQVQRGPYCGSVLYIGFNGEMDSSIAIRTFAIKDHNITFQAGGAVVADSDPAAEYQETLTKAKALRRALTEVFE